MVEKTKKQASKPKPKPTVKAKQRTLLDMFSKPDPVVESQPPETPQATSQVADVQDTGLVKAETTALSSGDEYRQPLEDPLSKGGDTVPIFIEETPPPTSGPPTDTSSPIYITDDEIGHGSSFSVPIVIDSSPVRPKAVPTHFQSKTLPSKTLHPFFAARAPVSNPQPPPTQSTSSIQSWNVPYPGHDLQHVRGPQSTPSSLSKHSLAPRSSTQRSLLGDLATPSPSYNFISPRIDDLNARTLDPPPNAEAYSLSIACVADSIPKEHKLHHPSIARLVERTVTQVNLPRSSGEAWTEKWRPRTADEVLGNEGSARYLRSWLQALKLQADVTDAAETKPKGKGKATHGHGKKRRRVITERGRARKRARTDSDEEDDWIVHTDEEEEFISSDTESDFLNLIPVLPSSSPGPAIAPPLHEATQEFEELYNTILLTGPPGSGKTASVYACAQELGWEVFEVYPGIGRRNGSNVEQLVGEVGKNHLVRHRPRGGQDSFILSSPSKRRIPFDRQSTPAFNGKDPKKLDDEEPSFAQSLILFEEVDVLFKEDANFWPTVIKIIKECKRPIICTCNDLSLVPVDDLPVQNVLHFESASSDVAASYLQAISYGEGRPVERPSLKRLLEAAVPDLETFREVGDKGLQSRCDLRHAINLLQVALATTPSDLGSGPSTFDDRAISGPSRDRQAQLPVDGDQPVPHDGTGLGLEWKVAVHEAEMRSFLDCLLPQSSGGGAPSIEDTYSPSEDDELGHAILFETKVDVPPLPIVYERGSEIRKAIEECVQWRGMKWDIEHDTAVLLSKKTEYRKHLCHVVEDVCRPIVWRMPLSHLHTDYVPYIKQMAEADEAAAEATMQRVQERGGRKTRNSGRTEYVRALNLSDLGQSSISSLCFSE